MPEDLGFGPRLGFKKWSQFLSGSSAKIGRAWDRLAVDGLGSHISFGARPDLTIPPSKPQPGWSCSIDCENLKHEEVSEDNPAIIRVALRGHRLFRDESGFIRVGEFEDVDVLIHKLGEPISQGGGNLFESEHSLLQKWTDLVVQHCLDADSP